jgi:hypothetical protein
MPDLASRAHLSTRSKSANTGPVSSATRYSGSGPLTALHSSRLFHSQRRRGRSTSGMSVSSKGSMLLWSAARFPAHVDVRCGSVAGRRPTVAPRRIAFALRRHTRRSRSTCTKLLTPMGRSPAITSASRQPRSPRSDRCRESNALIQDRRRRLNRTLNMLFFMFHFHGTQYFVPGSRHDNDLRR